MSIPRHLKTYGNSFNFSSINKPVVLYHIIKINYYVPIFLVKIKII